MNRSIASLLALATIVACAPRENASSDSAGKGAPSESSGTDLTGAGATFPQPIYSRWFSDYAAATGVKINYQSLGSGAGIQQLQSQTVDFGASDGPMSDDELARAKGGKVLHFPTVMGAVVITYNLPEITEPLKLSGTDIADIFLGKITKWNDARIASLNPGAKLPAKDILVVHRSDGSGTTYVFTEYLAAVSKEWQAGPGKGKEVKWPVGLGGKGNEGVAGTVKQTPTAIGYVELAYAHTNNLPAAVVKNASGNFVAPSIASVTAAAEGVLAGLPPDTDYRISISNSPGTQAYPISSLTWLLVYENQPDAIKGKKLVDFMRWMYATGQQSAPALDYAPLPAAIAQRLLDRLGAIHIGGQ